MAAKWALELASGARYPLCRSVTTIGRSSRCDIVIPDPAISRRQLLLFVRGHGVELIRVGKQPVTCNGRPVTVDPVAVASDGEQIFFAGTYISTIRCMSGSGELHKWFIRLQQGPLVQITGERFTLGGSRGDNLLVPKWPATALTLYPGDSTVAVESTLPCAALDSDGLGQLRAGARVEVGNIHFEVTAADGALERTTVHSTEKKIRLEPFRTGGLVVLTGFAGEQSVYLAKRRFALLHALLGGQKDGHSQSVAELCRKIWPGDSVKDETDFNVLLYRLRRDLMRASIDVGTWVERIKGIGRVRAPIAENPDVIIELLG